ncbi:MAG: hypothetical protein ACXV7D_07790 [Thermoanaerobaculia bacterium]
MHDEVARSAEATEGLQPPSPGLRPPSPAVAGEGTGDERNRENLHRPTFIVHRLIAALWFGSGFFLILAASAAFHVVADPFTAANVVGAMLTRWHYLALFAPVLLLILEWRRQRNRIVLLLFVAIILAALESSIDVRIAAMRDRSVAPISSLSPTNPVRRQFGMLHGLSTLLLIIDVVAAGAIVLLEPDHR